MGMKEAFWKSDRFVGLVISLVFLVAYLAGNSLLQALERDLYDLGVRMSDRQANATAQIAIVAIDDRSIEDIGRWPWSRTIIADMVDKLHDAGAKAIGLTVFYSEPQADPGLAWIRRIAKDINATQLPEPVAGNLNNMLRQAEQELDADGRLATSLTDSANTVLAMQFTTGTPVGNPDQELPDYLTRFAIPEENVSAAGDQVIQPVETIRAVPPIANFGTSAKGIGHLISQPDVDGGLRDEPLIVSYYDKYFPSQSLLLAAASLNLGVEDIRINLGESVQLGRLTIRTDPELRMKTFFYGTSDGRAPFDVDSFYDVRYDNVALEKYRNKIVLIGPTAFGVGSSFATPIGQLDGPVLALAHAVASILNEDFFVEPYWSGAAELIVLILVALYLILLLPKLKAAPAFIASIALLTVLFGTELGLLVIQATWLPLMTAATLLLVGHVLLTTKRFVVTELSKERLDIESSISYKQLAMQFKERGQLDMAFDHFRKCPVDDSLLQNIYDLALDYERKRQFNKALSAYSYIAEKNANFRDIKEKVQRARALEETVLLGGAGASSAAGSTLLLDGSISKPMLGRYQIEKELGKGAMGVVYLGRDPKINRVVAIKTMALAQEFEADELDEVKTRFFREAETAGRLQHPNIVTIYDAGEEHDLAYIAMEFLHGHDLVRYTKADNLLPVPIVMGIIYKAALALDYAHKNNVVHRDIKPANVMYEPDKKQVKLTDFGIARITDSSKTKTGMVLGTPSYMSPEQLSGKKVDGRSDLFSLGVMFYQMLTGSLPFKGDSMATLMYKIANEPHQALSEVRPDIAEQKPCINEILNKALQKDLQRRYQTGADMSRDIQQCAKQSTGTSVA